MPTLNEAGDIEEAINSLENQTFTEFELILVDGGSTDGTVDIVRSNFTGDLTVVEEERPTGISDALNRGLSVANRKYIARMDGDDRSLVNRLERQVRVLEEIPDIQVVTCWYRLIGQEGEPIVTRRLKPERVVTFERLVEEEPGFAHGSVLFRRAVVDEVGGYRSAFDTAEDLDLWLRIIEKFGEAAFHVIPDVLYEHRLSPDQMARRPQQRVAETYARKCAKRRRAGEAEGIDAVHDAVNSVENKQLDCQEREAMYHYLAGVALAQENIRLRSFGRFTRAIRYQPTSLRIWYQLALLLLPVPLRKFVRKTAQRIIEPSEAPVDHK